jgi:hypothetical protein
LLRNGGSVWPGLFNAFLPTEDTDGLGVLINGNFSTDPSRRHLIFDNETINAISHCGSHILKLVEKNLKDNYSNSVNIVNALIPYSDPRMLSFAKKSFTKLLLENLKQCESYFFKELKLCPSWLNTKDFALLVTSTNLSHKFYELDGFDAFVKYLGATEIKFKDLVSNLNQSAISFLGCVQITKFIFKSILTYTGINEAEIVNLKLLHCNGERKSLNEMNSETCLLDESFISLLLENGLTEFDLKLVLKRFSPNLAIDSQFQQKTVDVETFEINSKPLVSWFNELSESPKQIIKAGIKRWRSAEEQALEILNLNGFNLEDVSKQNIGYDLSGRDPNGKEIQIEIKSIMLPGQKFKMTNNEIAVAQEKQKSFYVAVVRQTENFFEIALISDPVNNLTCI